MSLFDKPFGKNTKDVQKNTNPFNERYMMTNFLLRTINIEKYVTSQVKELLSNEEKYIRQRVDIDIKNISWIEKNFNYPTPLVLSYKQGQIVRSLFERVHNPDSIVKSASDLIKIVHELLSADLTPRNKSYFLLILLGKTMLSRTINKDISMSALIDIYMFYILSIGYNENILINYGILMADTANRLTEEDRINIYLNLLNMLLDCCREFPKNPNTLHNIKITINRLGLEKDDISLELLPEKLLAKYKNVEWLVEKYKNVILCEHSNGILPDEALQYLFSFPKCLATSELIKESFKELISLNNTNYRKYFNDLKNSLTDKERDYKKLAKMILLVHPLQKNIDGLMFSGMKIPHGFSEGIERNIIELCDCYQRLHDCFFAVSGFTGQFAVNLQNLRDAKTINQEIDNERAIFLIHAIMCANVSFCYLQNMLALNRVDFALNIGVSISQSMNMNEKDIEPILNQIGYKLMSQGKPLMLAIFNNLPFSLSQTTSSAIEKGVITNLFNMYGLYTSL